MSKFHKEKMGKAVFKNRPSAEYWITITIYGGFLLALLILIGYVGRNVIFRPWTARNYVSVVAVNQTIYGFGGRTLDGTLYDDVLQIDLPGKLLKRTAKLPTACFGSRAVQHGELIYLFGGFNGKTYMDDILTFNPKNGTFLKAGVFTSPIAFGDVVTLSDSIIYLGGWTGEKVLDSIQQFDIKTGKIKTIGQLPQPLQHFTAVTFNNKIYIFGGENDKGLALDEILEFDPSTGIIARLGNLHSPSLYAKATVLKDKIYLVGRWNMKPLNDILEIRIQNKMIKMATFNLAGDQQLFNRGIVSLNDSIYFIGGPGKWERQLSILKFNPQTRTIQPLKISSYSWW